MSHIQFPYRGENTRRQHSSSGNSDFVTEASHNSIEREQAATTSAPQHSRAEAHRTATGLTLEHQHRA